MLLKLSINHFFRVLLQGRQGERGLMGFQGSRGEVVRYLFGDIKSAVLSHFLLILVTFFYDRVPPVSKDQQVLLDVPVGG